MVPALFLRCWSLVIAAALLGCTPAPRHVACANDGECRSAGEEFNYCLESRCVECVGSASCGEGNVCADGRCVRRCQDGRDCPEATFCIDGRCGAR
jgi:hypothetical protein